MEKFTVDLDKVLDDFEFTEEQAVRGTQYITEDLPAKKYQKPQFQRINLADADFSPKPTPTPVSYILSVQPLDCDNSTDNPEKSEISNVPDLIGGDVPDSDCQSLSNLPDLTENSVKSFDESDLSNHCESISQNSEFIGDSETSEQVVNDANALIVALDSIQSDVANCECPAAAYDQGDLINYLNELDLEEYHENQPEAEAEENKENNERQRPTHLDLPESEKPNEFPPEVQQAPATSPESMASSPQEPSEVVKESVQPQTAPHPQQPQQPLSVEERRLGKVSPFWVPDADAVNCMQCGDKFTVIKRRHHCRACGRVLCSRCCRMRAQLEYLNNQEHRVCERCFQTLAKVMVYEIESESESEMSPARHRPNPNNPMEYCSTVPPPLQATTTSSQPPPSVLVPVLKREGSSKGKESTKKVIFSDGIRPGGELTSLDEPSVSTRGMKSRHRMISPPGSSQPSPVHVLPPIDPNNQSFVLNGSSVPPLCTIHRGTTSYEEHLEGDKLIERLSQVDEPALTFAVNRYLVVSLKITKLDCCMGQTCWIFVTQGMSIVCQEEIIFILQKSEEETTLPTEIFLQLHYIYQAASKGASVSELGYWDVKSPSFLDSRQHGGFLFIRPTSQCLQHINKPPAPFLVAILIHRLELPWARLFPLRLMLRLGRESRYYPCSLVSVRFREPVYYEIGQTIINLLADFRNFSYTLPAVRGLKIHIQDHGTKILVPKNRYDQMIRALNDSNDPVLALAGNFSKEADAHLVCMQNAGDEVTYHSQAINIDGKPRKVTGASFVLFNASLKRESGVPAKTHIVEDGLMVQVSAETMADLRGKLRAMQDWTMSFGADLKENIEVVWSDDDLDFNIGVLSAIDGRAMDGVPSIKMHCGNEVLGLNRIIRWTEVFIIQCKDGVKSEKLADPPEVFHLASAIAKASCSALLKLLDMLATSGITKLAVRVTINQDEVSYEAGGNGKKLPPIYMNSLDSELIPVLHKAVSSQGDSTTALEDVFYIFDK